MREKVFQILWVRALITFRVKIKIHSKEIHDFLSN